MVSRLVLASVSPRRADLLREHGYRFLVDPSQADEPMLPHFAPAELTLWLAQRKAIEVAARHPAAIVLAADTLVVLEGEPLGKPRDLAHAAAMLARLSGRTHQVHTGVWLVRADAPISRGFVETSDVTFRRLSAAGIRRYLALVNPLDKAGGYAAQEEGRSIIAGIRGSLSNVIGLPMERLNQVLPALIKCDLVRFGLLPGGRVIPSISVSCLLPCSGTCPGYAAR